jgi:hypothetical protein
LPIGGSVTRCSADDRSNETAKINWRGGVNAFGQCRRQFYLQRSSAPLVAGASAPALAEPARDARHRFAHVVG